MELLNPCKDAAYQARTKTFTDTAGVTTAWPPGPEGVVIWADAACYVVVGEGVTATTANGTPIPANTPIPFKIPASVSGAWRVSAINLTGSATGNLYAKPIQIR